MSDWLLPAGAILAVLAAIAVTYWLAWGEGRLAGLHEAHQRDRHRDRSTYEQGVLDAARRAGEFLRKRGAHADAAALPVALLNDKTTGQQL